MNNLTFDEQDDDLWMCTGFYFRSEIEPIPMILTSQTKPDQNYID